MSLAEEAGKFLAALLEIEALCIDGSLAEDWFLTLHEVYHNECERWTYDPPPTEFDPNCRCLKLPGTCRKAEPGEAYIEELNNVFYKSAVLCGKLSSEEPIEELCITAHSAETEQGIIFINLKKFNKGTPSFNLLVDLIADKRRDGVTIDKDRHGKKQPQCLRDVLKNNGYENVAKKIKSRKKNSHIRYSH